MKSKGCIYMFLSGMFIIVFFVELFLLLFVIYMQIFNTQLYLLWLTSFNYDFKTLFYYGFY